MTNEPSKKRLRVLQIGPDRLARGGIASLLHAMGENAASFENMGVELQFVGTTRPGSSGVFHKATAFVHAVCHVVRVLAKSEVDVVHIHAALKGSLIRKTMFAWICILFRARYVFQIHNGGFFDRYPEIASPGRFFVRIALHRAEYVIVLSRYMRELALKVGTVSADRCVIIYNGIADPVHGQLPLVEKHAGATKIVFLGLISEAKGVPTLLEAVEILGDRVGEFSLTVYGTGDILAFEKELTSRGLNKTVTYGGWIGGKEKISVLSSADIFVLPSRSEGFSVAVLEAMAHGLPIISTSIPGVVDAVRNHIEAVLVAPGDAAALAVAIRKLLKDPDARIRMGVAARRRYLEYFTMEKMAAELSEIYALCV
ncbi:glycosyltransferase family 4 protein [Paraburkholderia sp. J10-1]|uniref:glycosyltransferase family 4 protein n=1 Tax=Paraburkholderia sp. J10-1 TaxID=2805430 RepID=UPI002AB61104|nr:glycosyltransferase family 4 protein [Paraburkholderia sp. J10-1]